MMRSILGHAYRPVVIGASILLLVFVTFGITRCLLARKRAVYHSGGMRVLERVYDREKIEKLREGIKRIQVGTIEDVRGGRQTLVVDGQTMFSGYSLDKRRVTASNGGILCLCSYSGRPAHEDDAENAAEGAISEVWIVTPTGVKRRVSPEGIFAFEACISPNGKRIAFSGRPIESGRLPSPALYIADLATDMVQQVTSIRDYMGWIAPLEWSRDGKILAVYIAEDECGSDPRIDYVSVK